MTLDRLAPALVVALLASGCDGLFEVNGRVVDTAGQAVPGALIGRAQGDAYTVTTDQRGCFHFYAMCPGVGHDETLTFSAPGHQRFTATWRGPGRVDATVVLARAGEPTGGRLGAPELAAVCNAAK